MDRLTLLENAIASVLVDIDGTLQGSGYAYKTVTGQVDVDEDVLATAKNLFKTDINHTITQGDGEEENIEWGLAQNIYTNSLLYTITSQIKLDGDEAKTRRSAVTKCNEVLSDIKYAFFKFHTLGKECNFVKYVSSRKNIATNGNLINSAQLITIIELNYSQSMKNPDIIAC